MSTIRDILGKVEQIECREAVWRKIIGIMTLGFLSRDATAAENKITLDSGAVVPEAYIHEILEVIRKEHLQELEERKEKLLSTDISQAPRKKLPSRKK